MHDVDVLLLAGNPSPDLAPTAADCCRGWRRQSGGQEGAAPCQEDAQGRNRAKGGREEARGCRCSPEMEDSSASGGGLARMIMSNLGALGE